MITKRLRVHGAMRCILSTTDLDHQRLVERARAIPPMSGSDFVQAVSVDEPFVWNENGTYHVAAFDYGIKYNILRLLESYDCRVTVLPSTATAEEALALDPDGVFLSNGPGDPAALSYIFPTVQALVEQRPVFGICLGHQILGHALGGKTFKLKFGHRGANHPILNTDTGCVEITSHNHGFAVDADSLDPELVRVTHLNLNDNSVAGLAHTTLPVFGVQYHPEASPGPHDSRYLFERFVGEMKKHREIRAAK